MTSSNVNIACGASGKDHEEKKNKRGRSKSRGSSKMENELGYVDVRLIKVELTVVDGENCFGDAKACLEEIKERFNRLQEMLEGTLNEAIGKCSRQFETSLLCVSFEILVLREENTTLKEKLDRVHLISEI